MFIFCKTLDHPNLFGLAHIWKQEISDDRGSNFHDMNYELLTEICMCRNRIL